MKTKHRPIIRASAGAPEKSWTVAIREKASDELEIVVYDIIGAGLFFDGITAKDVITKLRAAPQAKKITLRVNSVGGIVDEAKAMVNLLAERAASGVEVVAIVDGIAASSASYLLTAASRVEMPANAFQMLHGVRAVVRGTAEELEESARLFRRTNGQMAEAYAAASARRGKNKTAEDFLALFAAGDCYLDADEAIEFGLADQKIESLKVAACLADLDGLKEAPEPVRSALYVGRIAASAQPAPRQQELALNQPPPTRGTEPGVPGKETETMDLKVLAKMLGLAETATEAEVTAELNKRLTAQASVSVSGVQLLGVANEVEATAKIQEFQRGMLQLLGATSKATVAEAMGVVLEWKTGADQTAALTKQVAGLTEESRVAKRDGAIEKLSREGVLPPARHEWARAQFATAEAVETFCAGMPKGFFSAVNEPNRDDAAVELTADEKNICKVLGMSEAKYQEEKKLLRKAG
jgi:ATP-dependent protease ClpP protease subunit